MQVAATTSNTGMGGGLDLNPSQQKEMFLQLMVAQLQNQDPINPVGNEDFLGQMAQFTSVEQMISMVEKLDAMASEATFGRSISLIGKSVDYLSGDSVVAGVPVTAVSTVDGKSQLVLENGDRIDVSEVVRVQ